MAVTAAADSVVTMIKMRDFLHGIMHTRKTWNADHTVCTAKDEPLCIQIGINNEHGLNEALYPVVWNDADQFVIGFKYNSNHVQSGTQAIGHEKPKAVGELMLVNYNNIETLRAVIGEEEFDKACDKLGTTLVSAEQRENIRNKIFRMTDPKYYIANDQERPY
jgi:hypothetical protein